VFANPKRKSQLSLEPAAPGSIARIWANPLWRVIAIALIPVALLGLAAAVAPSFNYDRWDNFEGSTPLVAESHSQWLHGHVPQWSPHSFMGEPLIAIMQSGVFYLPYTLCLLATKVFALPLGSLPLLSVLMHSAIAVLGWYFLFARLGVRPVIGLLFGAGFALGGYWTDLSAVWIFMAPQCSWLPWLLYAIVRLAADGSRWSAALLAAVLTMEMFIGFLQIAIYSWLLVGLFTAGYLFFAEKSVKRLPAFLAAGGIAALASGPLLIPAFLYLRETPRGQPLSMEDFLGRSATPATAADILLPVYNYPNGFMRFKRSIYMHQGAWVAPAVVGALLLWCFQRRRGSNKEQARLWKVFGIALFCALIFYLMALGSNGFLLPLTYRIPLWSSMKWPFRIIPMCLAALTLAGGIGLELFWREERNGKLAWVVSSACVLFSLILLWINTGHAVFSSDRLGGTLGIICLIAGLAAMWTVLPARRGLPRAVLLAAAATQLVALVAFCHANLGFKTYPDVTIGPEELGINPQYRVLPLSQYNYTPDLVAGEYANFSSALRYGYDSVTGTQSAGLLPAHYDFWFGVDVDGVLPANNHNLLGSSLLRSFNTRYLVVAKDDDPSMSAMNSIGAYKLKTTLSRTLVYEDPGAMPRLFFARKVIERPDAFPEELRSNGEPATTAITDLSYTGEPGPRLAAADVIGFDWRDNIVHAQVRASGKSFLVISATYSKGWKAWVDHVRTAVVPVNGMIMGIDVPAGASEIQLRYDTPGLGIGVTMFLVALLLIAGWNWLPGIGRARVTGVRS
jgi:hypothetical protein